MISKILVSLGIFLCVFGLIGLAIVIYVGFQIHRSVKSHDEGNKKNTFEHLITVNYLALCLSTFGLITLALGLFLN